MKIAHRARYSQKLGLEVERGGTDTVVQKRGSLLDEVEVEGSDVDGWMDGWMDGWKKKQGSDEHTWVGKIDECPVELQFIH